jgi:potassium-dependent mechanosensitive channel
VLAKLKRVIQKSSLGLTVCILFVLSLVLFGGPSSTLALEDANWQNVLNHYEDAFRDAGNDLRNYESKLDTQTRDFARELGRLEKSKGQLMLWFGGSDDPDHLGYILRGIGGLRLEAADLFKPFAEVEHELDDFAIKLEEIEAEVKSQRGQTSTAEYLEALNKNLINIDALNLQMAGIKPRIEESREAYRSFLSHLEDAENATVLKTATYWKTFYFKALPGLFSADTLAELPRSIEQWKTIAKLWWSALTSPDEVSRWHKLLLKGLLLALGMILSGWVAMVKALGRLPRGFSTTGLLAAWILLCSWASFAIIGGNVSFVLCPIVFTADEILLPSGLVFLHMYLRSTALENKKSSIAALCLLWATSSFGLLVRSVVKPYEIALVLWILCLLLGFMYLRRKAVSSRGRLEKLHTTAAAYALLALGFLAAIGFLPLSLLFVSAIFYASIAAELGVDLMRLMKGLKIRAEQKYSEAASFFIGILTGTGFPVIFLALIYLNLWLLSLRLGGETVLDSILSTEAGWHDYHMSFKSLAFIILGFYVTKSTVFISEFFVTRLPDHREELDAAVVAALRATARYLCWGFFAICVLSLLGFNLMSLTVVAGGLSVGIGFGLQNIVNNLFSGLILLLGHSIQSGDTIQIGDMLGDVRKVTIRNTIVQTKDNATLFVPNSDLITNKLINWSHRDRRVVRRIAVGVAYGSDTEKIRRLLLRAAALHPRVLSDPAPEVLFSDFGASSLDFKVKFWIDDVDKELQVLSDVRYEIDRLFREYDVEIAFPQSTLHLQTAPALEKILADRKREPVNSL